MQRNHTILTCVYGLFAVAMGCITYVAFYNREKERKLKGELNASRIFYFRFENGSP